MNVSFVAEVVRLEEYEEELWSENDPFHRSFSEVLTSLPWKRS